MHLDYKPDNLVYVELENGGKILKRALVKEKPKREDEKIGQSGDEEDKKGEEDQWGKEEEEEDRQRDLRRLRPPQRNKKKGEKDEAKEAINLEEGFE
ncbi:hypothetical protein niasHT_018049 [Heterodera trifolii]|uniref:Protein kinase domain-containing protein n=1 Tax=Heterodera trifolii TaxID=157864 RepID=A0ABD2L8W7_9BILA